MSVLLTCPRGHQWEPPTGVAPAPGAPVCPECGAAVESSPNGETNALSERPNVPGYEILGEIGRDAVGVVYRARDVRNDRLVALKVIQSGHEVAERARFKAEAEAVAKLHHPNIAEIYEVGEANGRMFVAMEFVNGGSLAEQLDGQPWRPRPAAGLAESLARAVHVAHQAGIVHRGLKPASILMTLDSQPKIIDFGALGAPCYVAPEQSAADPKDVGQAADVHALGVVLYQLLTGRPPFQGAPLDAVVQMIGRAPVPPRQVYEKVPLDIEAICLKCLQKSPKQRYGSAEALAEDLSRFLEGKRIKAQGKPSGQFTALLTTVVFLLLAAVVGAVCWFAAEARYEPQLRTEVQRARSNHYDAIINRVQLAWEENDRAAMQEMLNSLQPGRTGGVDLRGFEWYYWSQLAADKSGEASAVFQGQPTIAFSRDGARLATVGIEGDVTVWDAAGHKLRSIPWKDDRPAPPPLPPIMNPGKPGGGPGNPAAAQLPPPRITEMRELVFRPDGTRLVGWSPQGPVHVWDMADGQQLFALTDGSSHKAAGEFRAVEYTPDGKTLVYACGSADEGWVGGWDAATGQAQPTVDVSALAQATVGQSRPGCAAFSPDRLRLALPLLRGEVEVWDAKKGSKLFSTDAICSLAAYSPDGRMIAGSHPDTGTIMVWDATTGKRVATVHEYPYAAAIASFSPDSRRLAAVNGFGLRVWNLDTQDELLSLKGAISMAFSPDGRFLATATPDGNVRVWKISDKD